MANGSSTTTTSGKSPIEVEKVGDTMRGYPIYAGSTILFYDQSESKWEYGEIWKSEEEGQYDYFIGETGWAMLNLDFAITDGRVDPSHIIVLESDPIIKSYEARYITKRPARSLSEFLCKRSQ